MPAAPFRQALESVQVNVKAIVTENAKGSPVKATIKAQTDAATATLTAVLAQGGST